MYDIGFRGIFYSFGFKEFIIELGRWGSMWKNRGLCDSLLVSTNLRDKVINIIN